MAARPRVKFISTTYLKEITTIEDNVDDNKLVPFIYKAQETKIQQALGSTFYFHLTDAISNSTLTSDEEDLIRNYIQPATAEWTLYDALPFLNTKLTNKAVSKESSEFSQPSDLAEVKFLRNNVRDMAEFYIKRLNVYLCDNASLFPVYQTAASNENLRKSGKSYFSGVFIPKNSSNNSCGDC